MDALRRGSFTVAFLVCVAGCALENPTLAPYAADGGVAETGDFDVVNDVSGDTGVDAGPDARADVADATDATDATDAGVMDAGDDVVVADAGEDAGEPDVVTVDAGPEDVEPPDVTMMDAGPGDVGSEDVVTTDTGPVDAGPEDTGPMDTGPVDAGPMDTGPTDTGPVDTGPVDTGVVDTGVVDTGPPDTGVTNWRVDLTASTYTSWRGGGHGNVRSRNCGAGQVMTGFGVRATDYVNELAARCASLNPDGSLGPSSTTDWFGGGEGSRVTDDCPSGQVAIRFDGRAGGIIDRLRAYCAPLQPWVTSGTTGMRLSNHGGGGGSEFDDPCPAGSVATGMDLDDAFFDFRTRIGAFRLRCSPIRR
ncbi:MAG: hypothetical protein R3A52_20200 [Polyangiales bacterium]